MARFKGLFRKSPSDEESPEPNERKPKTRQSEEEGTIEEALEEIEAEEEIP